MRILGLILIIGCGSVNAKQPDAPPTIDGPGSEAGQCGGRGEVCCAGAMCEARAACDGTACIAADVWSASVDGTFDFNGGGWTQPLLGGTTSRLPGVNGLWGTTSNFVVGVGTGGLILRFDGTTWHKDRAASADGSGTFFAVSGSSATDVWAVGDNHFAHFDGNGWLDVTPPPTNSEPWLAVWLSGPGEGWAVGTSGNSAKLAGGTWTKVSREGNGYDKNGLWGSSATDVWMVGQRHTLVGTPLSIEHFDGQSWTDGEGALDPQGGLPPLLAVWGADATHVYGVGSGGTIVFWNGTLWTSLLSGTTDDLRAIWGSNPNDIWVAGAGGIRHFNGMAWSSIAGVTAPLAVWLSPN